MSKDEIVNAYEQGVQKILEVVENLDKTTNHLKMEIILMKEINKRQETRLSELEAKINTNSKNSSLPPSSDRGGKKPINNRKKSGRTIGGQPGHEGKTLEKSDNPDEVVELKVPDTCDCGHNLMHVNGNTKTRQKFDIPPIKIFVTEYVSYEKVCPGCGKIHTADFPSDVKQPVEYGENMKSLMNYFVNYQLIPLGRASEAISDIVGKKVSPATIVNETKRFSNLIDDSVNTIKEKIISSNVVHFDETGLRSCGKTSWMHVASTDKLTHYSSHKNRGKEATVEIGILPNFQGSAVHDHWKPYYQFTDCTHAECNAHNLRHCKNVLENYEQNWAEKMASLLIEINRKVKELKETSESEMDTGMLENYSFRYHEIIEKGFLEDDEKCPKIFNKKGKLKNSVPKNLLIKFRDYDIETLAFMYDFDIPFDNNLAERDIRMQKLRQKISGCFRGKEGASTFCKIRSYLSTAKKNGKGAMEAIKLAVKGHPFVPGT